MPLLTDVRPALQGIKTVRVDKCSSNHRLRGVTDHPMVVACAPQPAFLIRLWMDDYFSCGMGICDSRCPACGTRTMLHAAAVRLAASAEPGGTCGALTTGSQLSVVCTVVCCSRPQHALPVLQTLHVASAVSAWVMDALSEAVCALLSCNFIVQGKHSSWACDHKLTVTE